MKYYILFLFIVWGAVCTATARERVVVWEDVTAQEASDTMETCASLPTEFVGVSTCSHNPTTGEFTFTVSGSNVDSYANDLRLTPQAVSMGEPVQEAIDGVIVAPTPTPTPKPKPKPGDFPVVETREP